MDYFDLYILEKYRQFRKKQKHLLRNFCYSPHMSSRIYLLPYFFFSIYVQLFFYMQHICKLHQAEIGKKSRKS